MEGDILQRRICGGQTISIHSLRMEGDAGNRCLYCRCFFDFNPLPPHGGRHITGRLCADPELFQSTPSAWRETSPVQTRSTAVVFQSTPSAWRETIQLATQLKEEKISIHSLRMEGDLQYLPPRRSQHGFQSTPSAWRETPGAEFSRIPHNAFQSTPSAWRETHSAAPHMRRTDHFNPLPPHGGRLLKWEWYDDVNTFQSTPSAWRETPCGEIANDTSIISIHSLRMEGDIAPSPPSMVVLLFQSTPSAWRETLSYHRNPICLHISIHSLRMEGDSKTAQESVFHFAYPCTILQKRMQKTTFCTRKNGFFRKKGEKFGAKPSASFCAPMIRTDTFPLNFSHRISGSSMSMVSFAPICSTFD